MPSAKQRVTASDVARSLGLSRATVGFVLNNTPGQTIPEKTRRRVLEEAERLGYRPNRAAQTLRRGSSHLVLLVLPDWPVEDSVADYLDELAVALDDAGYSLITYTRRSADRSRPLWETVTPDIVIGVADFDAAEQDSLRASGVRQIVTGTVAASEAAVAGVALQVEHLHALGHRRLAYAAARDDRLADLVQARIAEARAVAARLGLEPLAVAEVSPGDSSAVEQVQRWRDDGITGVVAYNDTVAAIVVGAALRAGIGVPAPLAVIGHDDTRLAEAFVPSLSSVRMDAAAMARYTAAVALHAVGRIPAAPEPVLPAMTVRRRESS
ncbi:LacI family DNA-binding transcriptional regulator [Nocardia aobensis]|uniref:LacI family DNA-binding transcriptional regulator n=1 Tax=Nocardia aobensis TaxID=257277 RepID=UPI00031D0411|nr:LacI family DNA-binding transcriptional regulator [Nocardia aobensis]